MRLALKTAALALAVGLAGMGHNLPPVHVSHASHQNQNQNQAVLPRRIVDENRRNQKLKQKLRRERRREHLRTHSRAQRKTKMFGPGYRPGKLFKGHRV